MKTFGAITIGQSPRPDVVAELRAVLGPDVTIVEAGALDDLSAEDLATMPGVTAGPPLVTRLRDGLEIVVGRDFVEPLVERRLRWLEARAEVVLLLCTGSFEQFTSSRPVLYPGRVLAGIVRGLEPACLGVLTPSRAQVEDQRERWGRVVPRAIVEAASPYTGAPGLPEAARTLSAAGAELIVMDCLGYTRAMKADVRVAAGVPVLLASSCLARVAAELA